MSVTQRRKLILEIEEKLNMSLVSIVHCLGQPHLRTQLALDILPAFERSIKECKNRNPQREQLVLYLRSGGGQINTVIPIHSIARNYFKVVNVLVHQEALSAATLLALGGKKIMLSPSGCLGPIDAQIALNTGPAQVVQGGVEDIQGYFEMVKDFFGEDSASKVQAFQSLVNRFPAEILGKIRRIERETSFIARRLFSMNGFPPHTVDPVIKYLSKDIPSHDYRIYLSEAKDIGILAEKTPDDLLQILDSLHESYIEEMKEIGDIQLNSTGAPLKIYRGFIESGGKSNAYISELVGQIDGGRTKIQKNDIGWREINGEVV